MPFNSPDKRKQYNHEYGLKHREEKSEYNKKYREEHYNELQEKHKQYRENNRERLLEYDRERNKNRSEEYKIKKAEYNRQYQRKRWADPLYKTHILSINRKHESKKRAEVKKQIYDTLGRICAKCGMIDLRCLQIDHIHGNGYQARKNPTVQRNYYYNHVDRIRADLQILCSNCNWIKRYENNELPKHERNQRDMF